MHNKYFFSFGLILGASLLLLSSCLKDDYTKQANAEIDQIKAYVNAHYPLYNDSINKYGFCYIETLKGTGDTAKFTSDYVVIIYTAKLLDGTTVFDSNDTTVQLTSGYSPSFKLGGPLTYNMGAFFQGLGYGISKMIEGGKATIIIPSTLTPNTNFQPRMYEVHLLKVYHNIATSRKQEFAGMINSLGFQLTDSTTHGAFAKYYGDTLRTYSAHVGDTVRLRYSGYLLDSVSNSIAKRRGFITVEDTLVVPSSDNYTIAFQDALTGLKRGWNSDVYIPYYSAYGNTIQYDYSTRQIVIPPYSNLNYHVELLGFLTKKNGVLVSDTTKNK